MAANLNVFADYLARPVSGHRCPGRLGGLDGRGRGPRHRHQRDRRPQATWTVDVFTVAKLLPLVLLIVLGLPRVSAAVLRHPGRGQAGLDAGDPAPHLRLRRLRGAAHPGRARRATPAATARSPSSWRWRVIASVYMLVQVVVVGVVPRVAETKAPLAAAFGVLLGPGGRRPGQPGGDDLDLRATRPAPSCSRPASALLDGRARRAARLLARVHPRFRTPRCRHRRLRAGRRRPGRDRQLRRQRDPLRDRPPRDLRPHLRRPPRASASAGHGGAGLPAAGGRPSSRPCGLAFCLWLLSTRSLRAGLAAPRHVAGRARARAWARRSARPRQAACRV